MVFLYSNKERAGDKMRENIKQVSEWLTKTFSYFHNEDNANRCDDIALFVGYVFEQEGISSCIAVGEFLHHPNGEYHVWNIVDGEVFDLSISQFGTYQNGWISSDIYTRYYRTFDVEEFDWNESLSKTNKLWNQYMEAYINVKRI